MHHLLWACQAWEEPRRRMTEEMSRCGIEEEELPRITRTQGIIFEDQELIKWRKEAVKEEREYEMRPLPQWKDEEDDQEEAAIITAEGRRVVFTDGSCIEQSDDRYRSAGCGTFVAKGHAWNTAFPLPGVVQSSELAEARAAVHILEAATAQQIDVDVRLDNETVVETIMKIVRGEEVEYEKGETMWRRARRAIERRRAEGGQGHMVTWMILKTLVHLTLHPKRYETRHKITVGDCNVLLCCEVHSFEKHPHGSLAIRSCRTLRREGFRRRTGTET